MSCTDLVRYNAWRRSVTQDSHDRSQSRTNQVSILTRCNVIPLIVFNFVSRPIKFVTRWKVLWESTTPHESEIWGVCRQHLATLATFTIKSIKCKQSPVYGVFFYRYFHIPLPIVTKRELCLLFSPRNLPIKFGTNPSTFLVITVTDRQTHKPTPVKHTPSLSRGEKLLSSLWMYAVNHLPPKV